jgi:hypothetical protein
MYSYTSKFAKECMGFHTTPGILANKKLKKHLATFGYTPTPHTPGLWTHKMRPIQFSLLVVIRWDAIWSPIWHLIWHQSHFFFKAKIIALISRSRFVSLDTCWRQPQPLTLWFWHSDSSYFLLYLLLLAVVISFFKRSLIKCITCIFGHNDLRHDFVFSDAKLFSTLLLTTHENVFVKELFQVPFNSSSHPPWHHHMAPQHYGQIGCQGSHQNWWTVAHWKEEITHYMID